MCNIGSLCDNARLLSPGLQGVGERLRGRVAPLNGAAKRSRDDGGERGGDVGVLHVDARRYGGKKTSKYMPIAPLKEALADEHLPTNDPRRPDVDAPIDAPIGDLLGRHVPELPLQNRGNFLLVAARGEALGHAGDAEIGEAGDAVGADKDVVRGDVAVNEIQAFAARGGRFVGGVEAAEEVSGDAHRDRWRERSAVDE